MKFSIDRESVAEIISSLISYSDDIDSRFAIFLDEIKQIVVRSNYDKLLNALIGVVDVYNETICYDMRKELIDQWIEERESLQSFAEELYMGEESEDAARCIEDSLSDIFLKRDNNDLLELVFEGEPNATKEDFDEAVGCFVSFGSEIEGVRDSYGDLFSKKSEENELYLFLMPIIESISAGIVSFLAIAKKEMDRLGDNFEERMDRSRQKVEESKKNAKSIELAPDLFDFDDDFSSIPSSVLHSGGRGEISAATPGKGITTSERAVGLDTELPDQMPKFGKKPQNVESEDKRNYDRLIQLIREFDSDQCANADVRDSYNKHLSEYYTDLQNWLMQEYERRDGDLKEYWNQLDKQLRETLKKIDGKYIGGTISAEQAQFKYDDACVKANQLYHIRWNDYWIQYNNLTAHAEQLYQNEVARCNTIVQGFSTARTEYCKKLFDNCQSIIDGLATAKVSTYVDRLDDLISTCIQLRCPSPCKKILDIYEEISRLKSIAGYDRKTSGLEFDSDDGFSPNTIVDFVSGLIDRYKDYNKEKDYKNTLNDVADNSFDRISGAHSCKDDLKKANPKYEKSHKNGDGKYTQNCQRCVIAYELRRRGYDVIAKPRIFGKDETGKPKDPLPSDGENGFRSNFITVDGEIPKFEPVGAGKIEEVKRKIEDKMRENGSRAILKYKRVDSFQQSIGGHVIIVENNDGEIRFVDPQSSKEDAIGLLGKEQDGFRYTIKICKEKCMQRDGKVYTTKECINKQKKKDLNCLNRMKGQETVDEPIRTHLETVEIMRIDNLKLTNVVNLSCERRK